MNRNVSTVDYNISRFFIQMRTRDRVTSACQRWWLWTTVTGDVVTQGQSSQGRRGAGVHGSTPYRRLATSAVSVALAKAAQAGFPRRGRPRPRKPGSSFGRWSPLVGLGHKSRRTHSLKGIVPEVAAHVSVVLGGPCGGGGVAQPHASTAASTAPVERTLMSSSAGHGAPAVHF